MRKERWWQESSMLPATMKVTGLLTCLLKLLMTSGKFLLSHCILRVVESRSRRSNLKTLQLQRNKRSELKGVYQATNKQDNNKIPLRLARHPSEGLVHVHFSWN
jgi:hypothetical protein